jgi:hypothetical protein
VRPGDQPLDPGHCVDGLLLEPAALVEHAAQARQRGHRLVNTRAQSPDDLRLGPGGETRPGRTTGQDHGGHDDRHGQNDQ